MNTTTDRVGAGLATAQPVERRHASGLPYAEFLRDYVQPSRPVVIEGALPETSGARQRWTPAYFRERFADHPVRVSYRERMRFAAFIDAVLASREDAPGPYMFRTFIGPHLPELLPDLAPANAYAFPRRFASPLMPRRWRRPDGYLKLLIGGTGGRFPVLHYDLENAHAMITEVYGDKEFVLFRPEDGAYLYPKPFMPNQSAIADLRQVDAQAFPAYAQATPWRTVLHPGDAVFVPARWWHAARVVTPSISVCCNLMDGSNWSGFVREVCKHEAGGAWPKRTAKRSYLHSLGALLALLEWWPRPLRGLAARFAPVLAAEAAAPSTWPLAQWDGDV